MGEPLRPERAAPQGKFVVWIEIGDEAMLMPGEFDTEDEAIDIAKQCARRPEALAISRLFVYDNTGKFRYAWET